MSSSSQQPEGLCLRYPDHIGLHRDITQDTAVGMLLRAQKSAQTIPFSWGYIDKPPEGQALLVFVTPNTPFPNDGIRYQDTEVKYNISVQGTHELEVYEVKYGYVPGQDSSAWRVRRRYRISKGGGHPQLVLVWYSRGMQAHIMPAFANQPVRSYPLRPVNEPSVYVLGEKAGQKVYPPGTMHGPSATAIMPTTTIGMGMNFNQQQGMVAQQNNTMEMMERRREQRERERRDRGDNPTGRPTQDDDSGDETDIISTRTLAMARYKRNHDLMNEVFKHAAYGDKAAPPPPQPYSVFNKTELEEKLVKLQAEVEALQAKSVERRQKPLNRGLEPIDLSMESTTEELVV